MSSVKGKSTKASARRRRQKLTSMPKKALRKCWIFFDDSSMKMTAMPNWLNQMQTEANFLVGGFKKM